MSTELLNYFQSNISHTIFSALGMSLEKLDANETVVSLSIDERHKQHRGIVHGGVYVVLAESAASLAGAASVNYPDETVVGLEINANHVKACKEGKITAKSALLHKGKNTLVYEVKTTNDKGALVSVSRCTLMVVKKSLVAS